MDRNVGRVNLHIRLGTFQHGIKSQSLADLNLNAIVFHRGDTRLGILVEPQNIRVVKLQLGPRCFARGYFVPGHERRIQRNRGEVTRVAPLHGDVAVDKTYSRYAVTTIVPGFRTWRRLGGRRNHREKRQNRNCQQASLRSHKPPRSMSHREKARSMPSQP